MVRMAKIELEDGNVVAAVTPGDLALLAGDWCVLDGGRNPEFGRVLRIDEVEPELPVGQRPPLVLRRANVTDQRRAEENVAEGSKAMAVVTRLVQASGLPMRTLSRMVPANRYASCGT